MSIKRYSTLLLLVVAGLLFGQTNFFVSVSGNNSNSGTLSSPWKTIQYSLNQMSENSVLNILPGTYKEKINIPKNNITLKNQSTTLPVIDASGISSQNAIIAVNDKINIIIDGLELANNIQKDAQGILVDGKSEGITIKNCKIHDIHFSSNPNATVNANTNAQGIIVYGTNGTSAIKNLSISNNELYNCRLGYSEGIAVNGNVDGFEVNNNKVHHLTNIGIDIIGFEGTSPSTTTDQARNGSVKKNTIYNCLSPYATSGGIYVDGGKSITIEGNLSYHNGYGIEIGCENVGKTTDGIIVRDNIFYDNQIAGLALGGFEYPSGSGKVINSSVINNTFFANGYSASGDGEIYLSYSEKSVIENNIFYTNSKNYLGYAELSQPTLSFNYNNFYGPGGTSELSADWNGKEYTGFAAFVSGSKTNANSIFGNPKLTNASTTALDFHILSTSPAINKGNPSYSSATSETDFYGKTRISGGRIDCGADEFQSETMMVNESSESEAFSVFPNPATSYLQVNSKEKIDNIGIYSLDGRMMNDLLLQNNKVDVSSLKTGVYFIKFKIKGSTYHRRFIKK